VKLVADAFDEVRRIQWQAMREIDPVAAKPFKGARWCLLKNPENLSDQQAGTLRRFRRRGGTLWQACKLKDALRAVFRGDLDADQAVTLLSTWCHHAKGSGIRPFAIHAGSAKNFPTNIDREMPKSYKYSTLSVRERVRPFPIIG
jgi:transposase